MDCGFRIEQAVLTQFVVTRPWRSCVALGGGMHDHEAAMQVYVQLAVISDQKHQSQVRDRFLLLAGTEACRAGWLDVAQCCHEKLIASNPAHQIHRFASWPDALRDADFERLVGRWERYCPFETAEAMLRNLRLPKAATTEEPLGQQMLRLLDGTPAPNDQPI